MNLLKSAMSRSNADVELWSGKPYMKKTVVKFIVTFCGLSFLLMLFRMYCFFLPSEYFLIIFGIWVLFAGIYFIGYYYSKQAYTFYITDKSVCIKKSWVFGTYIREITFDQVKDVHVSQGILARAFNCGSLMFATTTGLEVGYGISGVAVGEGITIGGGKVTPTLLRSRGNTFWDICAPGEVRGMLIGKLAEWREASQQQRMAVSLEKIGGKSIASELEKLNTLFEKGAITKEEYEAAKKRVIVVS